MRAKTRRKKKYRIKKCKKGERKRSFLRVKEEGECQRMGECTGREGDIAQ